MAYTKKYGMTLSEVAQRLGIDRSEVRLLERSALQKLRQQVPRRMLLAVLRERRFVHPSSPRGKIA